MMKKLVCLMLAALMLLSMCPVLAENAAILAAQILAVSDTELNQRLKEMRRAQTEKVLQKDQEISSRFA